MARHFARAVAGTGFIAAAISAAIGVYFVFCTTRPSDLSHGYQYHVAALFFVVAAMLGFAAHRELRSHEPPPEGHQYCPSCRRATPEGVLRRPASWPMKLLGRVMGSGAPPDKVLYCPACALGQEVATLLFTLFVAGVMLWQVLEREPAGDHAPSEGRRGHSPDGVQDRSAAFRGAHRTGTRDRLDDVYI